MNHRENKRESVSIWFLVGLASLGTTLILARNATYGPELWWDSVAYIHVARSLLAGEGFVEFNGSIYSYWPPLYPMLLATMSLFIFDPRDVAPYLNASIFGLTLFFIGRWLCIRMNSNFLIVMGCLAIALSPTLTWVASMVSSEATFIFFVILALIKAEEFLIEDNLTSLLWSAVFASLACLTRYTGIILILTTIILLFLILVKVGRYTNLQKFRLISWYLLISTVPLALWTLRNFLIVESVTGARYPRPTTPMRTAEVFLDILTKWILPELSQGYIRMVISILLVLSTIALVIVVGHVAIRLYRGDEDSNTRKTIYIFGSFLLIYILFIAAAVMTTESEPASQRYLSPLYIPFVLTILVVINSFPYFHKRKSIIYYCIITIFISWIIHLAAYNVQKIGQANNNGDDRGLSSPHFSGSQILQYMRKITSQDSWIFGNQIDAMYLHTNGVAKYRQLPLGLENFKQNIKDMPDGAYIVLMHQAWGEERFGYDAADFRILSGLKLIEELSDGVVFEIDKSVVSNTTLKHYRQYYESVTSGEPVFRSNWEVFLLENKLVYTREPCSRLDTRAGFFLYITPTQRKDLPMKYIDLGFDILDFEFDQFGIRFDGKCLAVRDLPNYHFTRIHTGQYGGGVLWEKATSIDKQLQGSSAHRAWRTRSAGRLVRE